MHKFAEDQQRCGERYTARNTFLRSRRSKRYRSQSIKFPFYRFERQRVFRTIGNSSETRNISNHGIHRE